MDRTTSMSNGHLEQRSSTVLLGRQPILSQDLTTYAYELLFRSNEDGQSEQFDGERATAELLLNSLAEVGLDRIVGDHLAFINVPEEFLVGRHCLALPKDRIVVEVLEHVRPTERVLAVLTELRQQGYTIALDDFVAAPELTPLVELADIVKVDLPLIPPAELADQVDYLRRFDVKILAEKVETPGEFEHCRELGFDYYQGYFFAQPTIVRGRKIGVNKLSMLRLVSKLHSPFVSLEEIVEIIQSEPALTYQLLCFVNSARSALTHEIESIKHAVAYAGIEQIKLICSLTALARAADNKSGELFTSLLIRAKMAELIAEGRKAQNTDTYFLAGLFSGLDAMLDLPISEALEMVSVSKEIVDAIISGSGKLGHVLSEVIEYERGTWEPTPHSVLDGEQLSDAYLNAIEWVHGILSQSADCR